MYPGAATAIEQNVNRTIRTMNILRLSRGCRWVHNGREMSKLFLLGSLEASAYVLCVRFEIVKLLACDMHKGVRIDGLIPMHKPVPQTDGRRDAVGKIARKHAALGKDAKA